MNKDSQEQTQFLGTFTYKEGEKLNFNWQATEGN